MFSLIQVFFIRVFSLVFCLLYQHFESTLIKGGLLKLFQRKKNHSKIELKQNQSFLKNRSLGVSGWHEQNPERKTNQRGERYHSCVETPQSQRIKREIRSNLKPNCAHYLQKVLHLLNMNVYIDSPLKLILLVKFLHKDSTLIILRIGSDNNKIWQSI